MESDELRHIYDVSLFNISDLDVLLHEILKHTRELLNSEAGTIYIKNKSSLKFHVFQNDALSYEEIYKFYHSSKDFSLPLCEENKYLAVDSFLNKKIIIVDDAYNSSYDFFGVKEFDIKFNYKTRTLITVPLIHPINNNVLGIIQLLNKKEGDSFPKFTESDKDTLSMFSSFISLSISKAQNDVDKLQDLNKRLEDANESLEKKIKDEISDNENKSAIIFHQSKMASMGEMMGNIAHQWRQPLSTISTLASGVSLDFQLNQVNDEKAISQLNKIVSTTQELSNTIDDFRNFYNIDTIKETFNISTAIHKSLEIAESVMTSNHIELVLNLDTSIEIYGLKNEFTQSILNILTNAKDALMENLSMDEKRLIVIDLYKFDDKVHLKIKDNAKGIPEEISKNIFAQHFTTKSSNGGTGVGLFMTKLIVEKHMNGTITFQNLTYTYDKKEYVGALFEIILA